MCKLLISRLDRILANDTQMVLTRLAMLDRVHRGIRLIVTSLIYTPRSFDERTPNKERFIHPDWAREDGGNIQKGIADAQNVCGCGYS